MNLNYLKAANFDLTAVENYYLVGMGLMRMEEEVKKVGVTTVEVMMVGVRRVVGVVMKKMEVVNLTTEEEEKEKEKEENYLAVGQKP